MALNDADDRAGGVDRHERRRQSLPGRELAIGALDLATADRAIGRMRHRPRRSEGAGSAGCAQRDEIERQRLASDADEGAMDAHTTRSLSGRSRITGAFEVLNDLA